jgi:hypothetical protein
VDKIGVDGFFAHTTPERESAIRPVGVGRRVSYWDEGGRKF